MAFSTFTLVEKNKLIGEPMKSLITTLLLAITLSSTAFADDLSDGFEAAQKGDYKTAMRLWKPWAEQGDAKAQYNLGLMYRNGYGVPKDDKQAVKWYRLAAEQGIARAQTSLGLMYANGYGVPEDDKEAVKWFRLAVEQGDGQAQNSLGNRYEKGEGVIINYIEAVRLYNLSARQGGEYGMYNLARMYKDGKGVEEDKIYSYMWFNLANEAGHSSAKDKREELSEKMTTKELRVAQELSQKCLDSNYKDCESALPNFLHRKLNLSDEEHDDDD